MKKNNKKESQETVKNNSFLNILSGVIVGMFICVTMYFIYNIYKLKNIEDVIRYIVMGVLILITIIVLFKYLKFKKRRKVGKCLLFIIILLIFGSIEFYISIIISKGVNVIDKMSKDRITYTSSLIALKDGDYTDIEKIDDASIAIISDTDDTEGYVLAQNIIEKNKISKDNLVEYDDYISMLTDLYDKEVDAAFVSGSYVDKYSSIENFENIKEDVVELDSYSKIMKKQTDSATKASNKSVTEPFTILLLGVDSETEDISKTSGLGDTIMLVTFNPKTLNATVFSIPRDTYVQISCYRNALSKITHAASGGDSCMINTVENFTGIDIDYYVKINFNGLIKLVDSLGGIDVEVPYAFCESDETRSYLNTIYVDKGWQHLNGKQALALSRNRKTLSWCGSYWNQGTRNDFVRGQNQQLVVNAIVNKVKEIKSINKLYEILDTISISLDTNLSRDQILNFYNVLKKIVVNSQSLSDTNNLINMQKTYLNGSGGLIYDNIMNMNLYEYVPSSQSLNAIIKAMKVNLELEEEEYETSFSFSIDKEYEPKVIGSDLYGGVKSYPSSPSNNSTQTNTCDTNEELGADGVTCVCKNGYERTKSGTCEKKETKACSTNEELGADGVTCVCKNGYERTELGTCEKKETKTCGTNKELGADGVTCVCKNGYTENSSGVCVKDDSNTETGGNTTGGSDSDKDQSGNTNITIPGSTADLTN